MDTNKIKSGLTGYDPVHVDNYIAYLIKLESDVDQNKKIKNIWMKYRKDDELIRYFKTVYDDGLVFDGIDITLQSTGVSYSYQAYKNKMFLVYPESIVDVNLVYKGDVFNFNKNSGSIDYTHHIDNPFDHKDEDIIGAYCVIKNKRGNFLTTLSRPEIDKHRRSAKTDSIWKNWLPEMTLKTVLKKACKQHFKDSYQVIELLDNENSDPNQPMNIEVSVKSDIEEIKTISELQEYWEKNKDSQPDKKDFNLLISNRKKQIEAGNANI